MRVTAQVLGADALARAFAARAQRSSLAAQVALEEAAQIVSAEAQRSIIDGPKTGRVYKKYVPRRDHQASAPGEPPANDQGNLAANIIIDRAELSSGRIRIASLAAYSKVLELGGRFIAPRPFLRRALMVSRRAVARAFQLAYRRLAR